MREDKKLTEEEKEKLLADSRARLGEEVWSQFSHFVDDYGNICHTKPNPIFDTLKDTSIDWSKMKRQFPPYFFEGTPAGNGGTKFIDLSGSRENNLINA